MAGHFVIGDRHRVRLLRRGDDADARFRRQGGQRRARGLRRGVFQIGGRVDQVLHDVGRQGKLAVRHGLARIGVNEHRHDMGVERLGGRKGGGQRKAIARSLRRRVQEFLTNDMASPAAALVLPAQQKRARAKAH